MTRAKSPVAGFDWIKHNGLSAADTVQEVGKFSMARQEFAEECDINTIMERYQRTGVLPANAPEPVYYDFTEIPDDLLGVLRMMDEAQEAFMQLPAKVRLEFGNNAAEFVEFATQPSNLEQMRAWGLSPPAPAAPTPAEPGTPPEPSSGGTTQSST